MQIVHKNNINQNLASLKTDLKLIEIAKDKQKSSNKPMEFKGNASDFHSPKK